MAKNFFATLTMDERRSIKNSTNDLIDLLKKWAQKYSAVHTARIPAAALTTAVVLPHLSSCESVLSSLVMLWIAGVDDLIDKKALSLSEMRRKVEQWCSIANFGSCDGMDCNNELTAMLVDMQERLSEFETFEPLHEYWASCLRLLLEAMIQEHRYALQYRASGILPSLSEYLRNGMYSIGMHFWQSTVLTLFRDSSVLEHFGVINETIDHCSRVVRLYNDFQTFEKEMREGVINSIFIVCCAALNSGSKKDMQSILFDAKEHILELADFYIYRCRESAERIQTKSGQFEEAICRLVAFVPFFYSEHDYHTTSMAKVNEFLGVAETLSTARR